MQQKDFERLYEIKGKVFDCVFKALGFRQFRKSYSSEHLAWAAGQHWKSLNPDYDFEVSSFYIESLE